MTAYLSLATDALISNLSLDLLSGTFYLDAEAFEIDFTIDEEQWMVLSLASRDTAANIRTALRTLDDIRYVVDKYDRYVVESDACYLTWRSDGEGAKRALVTELSYKMRTQNALNPMLTTEGAFVELAIKHRPWEDSSTSYTKTLTTISNIAGSGTVTTQQGSATSGGRIVSLAVTPVSGDIGRAWVGVREEHSGFADFDPLWELEDSGFFSDAVTTADANASGGVTVQTDFSAEPDMSLRITARLGALFPAATMAHFIGEYTVLVRMCLSAGSTVVRVSLYGGIQAGYSKELLGETWITNSTDYLWYPMGIAKIPPSGYREKALGTALQWYAFELAAQQVSGSGELNADCICLVPAEHSIYLEPSASVAAGSDVVTIYGLEDGKVVAYKSGTVPEMIVPATNDWRIPPKKWLAVYAADDTGDDSDTATLTFTIKDTFTSFEV